MRNFGTASRSHAGEIAGAVTLPAAGAALVVAECGGIGLTAVPGSDGTCAIFNVPDGTCTVSAYAKGASFTPVSVSVAAAGVNPVTADLHPSSVPTATVSGSVQFRLVHRLAFDERPPRRGSGFPRARASRRADVR